LAGTYTGCGRRSKRPNMDFTEKDGKHYLTAELPGIDKENITVTVEDGYLSPLVVKRKRKKRKKVLTIT